MIAACCSRLLLVAGLLALGALGLTLIYGILRFSNFAHGDTMAFGTMVTILFTWWFQALGISLGPLPTALLALLKSRFDRIADLSILG